MEFPANRDHEKHMNFLWLFVNALEAVRPLGPEPRTDQSLRTGSPGVSVSSTVSDLAHTSSPLLGG